MSSLLPMQTNQDFGVIHLSTSHTGGAGIAARRLNQGLRAVGFRSEFMAVLQDSYAASIGEYRWKRNIIAELVGGLIARVQVRISDKTFFSISSASAFRVRNMPPECTPENTIIHIHNFFNLLSFSEIEKLLERGYKIVFTLHDQRLMTAGCHYSLDCNEYRRTCHKCPLAPRILQPLIEANHKKLDYLKKFSEQIVLIAPSEWIKREAEFSSSLNGVRVHKIANYINFYPATPDSKSAYKLLGSPLVIGIASMEPYSYIKGGFLLKSLEESAHCTWKIIKMSDLDSAKIEKDFWDSIDFLLVPSLVDNSPNVIHEARVRGVPVIATDVGGISELLDEELDLKIPKGIEIQDLIIQVNAHAIRISSNIESLKANAYRSYVESNGDIIQKHILLYSELMARS